MREIQVDESVEARRRVYFHLVDATDGLTAETGEAAGQPQISSDGAAWTNTGIATLTAIGNGRYYAALTAAVVATSSTVIETRYKSANTAECPGDTVLVVTHDPNALSPTITPLSSTVSAGAVNDSDLTAYQHAAFGIYIWTIVDSDGDPVNLSGKDISYQVYDPQDTETELWVLTTAGSDISVGGANNNQVTIDADDTNTATAGAFRYTMRNTTDDRVIATGNLTFVPMPA